jgi:hypothetical protein
MVQRPDNLWVKEPNMPSHKQTVPIDRCDHVVQRFDGAWDMIEVQSPDGEPVDVPVSRKMARGVLLRHALEVGLAFAVGFMLATLLVGG